MTKKKNAAAVSLGRRGGSVKSDAKTEAVRRNGKLGGRPRKPLSDDEARKLLAMIDRLPKKQK
jgi:hypothetical protein